MLIVVDLLIYPLDIIARAVSAIIGEKPTVLPAQPQSPTRSGANRNSQGS